LSGGFVCGPRRLIAWLVNHARPYIFSTGLAPPAAAAARRAVRVVLDEPERRRALGLNVGPPCCQIVPVFVGTSRAALALARRLEAHGLLVPAIRPPAVPEGTARLRLSVTAGHDEEDVSFTRPGLTRWQRSGSPG
jgi:7-keto-8-aminopelargonate synthetase-like enzyme